MFRQSSVLGPSLFSSFINDLPSNLPSDSTIIVLFANDTTINIISNNLTKYKIPPFKSALIDLANLWKSNNGLFLIQNETKCMLLYSCRKKITGLKLSIHGKAVDSEQVQVFKYFGVLISMKLLLGVVMSTWSVERHIV